MLTGTGADGAYHAGVLRALHEAGIKIDLVCGRGIGAVSAMLVAVDGGSRLWDQKGLWRAGSIAHLYRWRWPIRVLFALLAALAGVLASPLVFLALAILAYPLGLLFGMAGLESGANVMRRYLDLLGSAFAPGALPTWLPRLITFIVIAGLLTLIGGSVMARRRSLVRRRSRGPLAWAILGAPLEGARRGRPLHNRSLGFAPGRHHAQDATRRGFEPPLFGVAD